MKLTLFYFVQFYVVIATTFEPIKGNFNIQVKEDESNYRTRENTKNEQEIIVLVSRPNAKDGDEDPTENPDSRLFEGDIEDVDSEGRNAIIAEHKKWPGKIIPYEIEPVYNKLDKKIIKSAMDEFHKRTCIQFVPRTKQQKDYIVIRSKEGCSSHVGKKGGKQQVSLGKGCLHRGVVIHELMHAVGFWHEQSRGDRDDHVTILWNNIEEGRENNFQKYNWDFIQHLNESYDLDSIMHYKAYAFAKDKKNPTIIPKDVSKLKSMGQRVGLSRMDVRKINTLYDCHSKATKKQNCVDDRKKCVLFSKKKYCQRYEKYMQKYCRKSCGFCKESQL